MHHCTFCTAVFTTRRQWKRHTSIHLRFTCNRCQERFEDNEALRTHIAMHFNQTATQTGAAGAAIAEKVLTPTKHRRRTRLSLQVYQKRQIDPLGLHDTSDEETTDPRHKR